MRTMYDAVTARNILKHDRTPEMVAGYVDRIKLAPWTDADWALFPGAVKVEIVKKASSNFGHVLDVEPGDARPDEAPGWVVMRRKAGADPTVYMNASTWPTVRAAFRAAGVPEPHYWVAKYDKDPAWPKGWAELGCVAKQYLGNFEGIDKSSVAEHWPGVDPKMEDDDMLSDAQIADWNNKIGSSWAAIFVGGGENPLRRGLVYEVADMQTKLNALASGQAALAAALAKVNSLNPSDVAAALLPGLTAELGDVKDLDAEAVAVKLDQLIAARFAE